MVTVLSFIICSLLVAIISWYKTKSTNLKTIKGLFLAGKNNNYLIVASSLLLTNLSANQFIGENESVYINNMSVMAWGVTSVFAMLIVSEYFLPVYLKGGMITTADFLSQRYDEGTKRLVSIIFLLSYAVNLLPPVLYGGAVALTGMFNLQEVWGLSYWQCIWLMVWILGLIGGGYTILGGLRAISISDTLLSVGLLVLAILLPIFSLYYLGQGNIASGLKQLLNTHTDHLNAVGSADDAIPFGTIFTGMLLVNLYYWGVEQYIIQQTLAAKSLKEAQKGMALAALAKLFTPLLINLPGLIAVHLYANIDNTAAVFPLLASDVLPNILQGMTIALLFGAAITTYNAGLHSSSTLFVMNIYLPLSQKKGVNLSDIKLIHVSRRFEILLSLIAMFTAPFILFVNSGFYTYLQRVAGLFSLPIFTIIIVGFFTKKVPPIAAKIGLVFFMLMYFLCEYVFQIELHYLHVLAIFFILTVLLMLLIGKIYPHKQEQKRLQLAGKADLIAWPNRHWAALILLLMMVGIYLFFSPWGIAK
ncbi:MAG TPA: solute:sodium symporter family transporter [Pseudosphingobacterium sp.]|nr:solute:sodium symporter family transporter [Pseudosphingobacterium sp.]